MKIENKEKVVIESLKVTSDCLDLNLIKPNLTKISHNSLIKELSFVIQTKDFGEVSIKLQPFTENQVNNVDDLYDSLRELFWSV